MQKNTVLVTITGKDKPGITSSLTKIIAESKTKLIDIEQVVTHDILNLSIIIQLNGTDNGVIKELLFKAKEIGINLDFEVISDESIINRSSVDRYAITCIGSEISAGIILHLSKTLSY